MGSLPPPTRPAPRRPTTITRRSLLTTSAAGTLALVTAIASRDLPALADNGHGNGNGHRDHPNRGRNHDRNRRSNRKDRQRNQRKDHHGRGGRGNANGGFANGALPTMKDVVIEGNGDPSDNLEQKRDRRRNKRERRRDRRRRGN